jgi:hypothetical protein
MDRNKFIYDMWKMTEFPIISNEFIRANLPLFITGISLVEFCFDFKPENIHITESANTLNQADKEILSESLEKKLRERADFLIIDDDTTAYSNDYNKKTGRKSTLKLYDREKRLLEKKTEYPADFIKKNPYKKRIEFILQNRKSPYLNLNNFDGNYYEVIERFIPYLAKLYKRYFLNKVYVNSIDYKYFDQIYTMSKWDSIPRNKELKSNNKIMKDDIKLNRIQKLYKITNKLRIEERKRKNRIKKLEEAKIRELQNIKEYPDNYYTDIETIPYHTLVYITWNLLKSIPTNGQKG